MAKYSFKEVLDYFSEKLKTAPPPEAFKEKEIELSIDDLHVLLMQGMQEGSLHLKIALGLLIRPIQDEHLKELAVSNFLGINTGGCTLAFDPGGVCLSLHGYTTAGADPQENWEWLHRTLCVAREWNKLLRRWEEFVPLSGPVEEKKNEQSHPARGYKA